MKPTSAIDPELHILRTVARSRHGRKHSELEQARYNLFAAFERQNRDEAERWAKALRVALEDMGEENPMRAQGLEALGVIEAAL